MVRGEERFTADEFEIISNDVSDKQQSNISKVTKDRIDKILAALKKKFKIEEE